MRSRIFVLLLVLVVIVLAACGSPSKEDIMKKLSGKWDDSKGYELDATMEIKTGAEPRVYDVEVWHTKPDFYRVHVSQEGKEESQMIVRNEDGVFVVTPSLGKTYTFQSDWPEQNSQAYLISALAGDIQADEKSTMMEEDETYIFETATRNNHKKVLPKQQIHIDKKTLLPKHVSVIDEAGEEQIRISFKKITLGTERKASDYDVEVNDEESPEDESDSNEEATTEEKTEEDEKTDEEQFNTYYPSVDWPGVTLIEDEKVKTENGVRFVMTFGGEKEFTLIQERASTPKSTLPVSVEGDPIDLGFTVAALTDHSLSWESGGVSYFLASKMLTSDEMIEVATSMSASEMK